MRTFHGYVEELALRRHPSLNPKLWDGDRLRPEVREALLRFAKAWQGFAKIPDNMVRDVWMVGGNASYFYSDGSDIDVHLLVDRSALGHGPIVDDFLKDRKTLWGLKHQATVRGYALEPYAQDVTERPPPGQGAYSLTTDSWVQRPSESEYDPSQDTVLAGKVAHWQSVVDKAVAADAGADAVGSIKDRLAAMRKAGISRGGELNPENLVFKEVRSSGHLQKITDYLRRKGDQALSLA